MPDAAPGTPADRAASAPSSPPSPARTPPGRALVLGEALVDIVVEAGGATREHVGGSPLNVALGLARLGHFVDFATTLGPDGRGERIRRVLADAGVDLVPGVITALATSTALARLDGSGAATYEFDLHFDLPVIAPAPGVGHAHTGSIGALLAPGDASVKAALVTVRGSGTVSYDPNVRPSIMGAADDIRGRIEHLVALADVVKASSDDLAYLYPGESLAVVLDRWGALGPALTVVTLGADGVTYRTRVSPDPLTLPTSAGDVVDTVGAGDSFMAGLLSGLLDLELLGDTPARGRLATATSGDVRPAVERGLATSAVTVAHAGAYAPTREDL